MDRRHLSIIWGIILGLPCIGIGVWMYTRGDRVPPSIAYPLLFLGGFAIVVGAYITYTTPKPEGYETIAVFRPTARPAYIYAGLAAGFLVGILYLLYGSTSAYIWSVILFFGFLGSFLKALITYWNNMLTTYYVTSERLISEYRFSDLNRTSFEHADVTKVSRDQSVLERLLGLGTIEVSVTNGTITLDALRKHIVGESEHGSESVSKSLFPRFAEELSA